MSWNLDIDDYTENELLELFGLATIDDNHTKSQMLVESIKKVQNDTSKLPIEIDSFINFVCDASKRIGVPNFNYGNSSYRPTESQVVDKAFSTRQPITQVNSHMLIDNERRIEGFTEKQYGREVDEDRNPPGKINPVKVHSIFKAVNIDSRFRDNYYTTSSTDFSITLPIKITNCVKLQLGNLTIPLTTYCFNEENGNTTFVINVTRTPGPVTTRYVITIPDGNYSTQFNSNANLINIQNIINTTMNTAGINTTTELAFNIDIISGKSVFSVPAGSPVTAFTVEFATGSDGVILTDDNLQLRLGWNLGFRNGIYTTTGPTIAIASEGICVPVCPRYMFLVLDDYQPSGITNYFNAGYQSSLLPNNILTRIDIGSLNGEQGYFTLGDAQSTTTAVNTTRLYFGPVTIEKLRVSLYDEYGRIVNLNNMDWSVSFSMTCLYE